MASILLGMLGNGLMVPRALYTRDKIWFIGVGWGPLTGWVQLLSLYVAHGITGYVHAAHTVGCMCTMHTSEVWTDVDHVMHIHTLYLKSML